MKIGLIGHPISHSKSPELFAKYMPEAEFELIETSNFCEAIRTFTEKFDATTVTAPFKEDAFRFATSHDELCQKVGATNLIVKEENEIKAYNTDVFGVQECLKKCLDFDPSLKKVLVIGCSGAGKAACVAALDMDFETTVCNRSIDRCIDIKKRVPNLEIADFSSLADEVIKCDILISTLPVELSELRGADLSKKVVIEANYRDPFLGSMETSFLVKGEYWLEAHANAAIDILRSI